MEAPIAELKDRLQEAMNLREKKAADLANDLEIPKSALSQYLSGKSKNMDSVRMYRLCVYLNVNEAWMMGFDVPMERPKEKNNDIMSDIIVRLRTDEGFFEVVETLKANWQGLPLAFFIVKKNEKFFKKGLTYRTMCGNI